MQGKTLLLILVALFLLVLPVYSSELRITQVDAYLNGDLHNDVHENVNTLEVTAGDKIKFIANLENNYARSTRVGVHGIELSLEINKILNPGNFYTEIDTFGLNAADDVEKEIDFVVPKDILAGQYKVEINANGFDDTDLEQDASIFFEIRVVADQMKVFLEELSIEPKTDDCENGLDCEDSNSVESVETSTVDFKRVSNVPISESPKDSTLFYILIIICSVLIVICVLVILYRARN